jgi:hypothetical protein
MYRDSPQLTTNFSFFTHKILGDINKIPHIFISFEPRLALKERFRSKSQNINFHDKSSSRIPIVLCGQTDRHSHGEAVSRFSQLRV